MTDLLLTLARPSFTTGMLNWLATAPMDEIESEYSDNFKGAHGFRPRWVHGADFSREWFADAFESLAADYMAVEAREQAENEALAAHLASLGLTSYAAEKGIRTQFDVLELNYATEYTPDPPALPYEDMVPLRLEIF
jgi:hypothetical protein